MKSKLTTTVLLLIGFAMFAQQGINYKALIKDDLGNVVANATNITVQFTIYEGAALTNEVYYEAHSTAETDTNGILIVNIGEGDTNYDFSGIGWENDEHWLNIQIDIGNGLVDMGTTQFMVVPYAKHANTAANVTGLEAIDEGNGIGWRLIGSDAVNYGNIGDNAVDLSKSSNNSTTRGATGSGSVAMGNTTVAAGENSTAMGFFTRALGDYSTAMGDNTIASGESSTAIGYFTNARSRFETAIGANNTDYTPNSPNGWNLNDRLFVIGNSINIGSPSDALTVLKNGTITAPSYSISEIETAGNKALITKEYADSNYLIDGGNVVSNNVGIGRETPSSLLEVAHKSGSPEAESLSVLNTDTNNAWQFHTTNYLNLYQNGVFKGSWNATSGAYVQASDRRVKKDITTLDNGTLNKVMQLNPVSYLMKDQTDSKRNLGLISQEVKEIFPSITHYVEESDLLALSYTELIPILIKALQEQQVIIENQNTKIEAYSLDKAAIDKTLQALLKRIETIENMQSN